MSKLQLWSSLLLNLFVLLSVAGCCAAFFLRGGKGNMQRPGFKAFVYFTVDSNVLCALACLGVALWDGIALGRGGEALLPRWLDLFKFAGSAAVGVTFFTVLFYLLPVTHFDFHMMYDGRNLLLHGLCPLAAMLSWALTERSGPLGFGWVLFCLIPTALYAGVYGYQVLVSRRWEDFYSFNKGGLWPVSVAAMLLLTFLIAAGLWALRG